MATGLEDLKAYKLAEDLEIKVHELTDKFPADEKHRTVDQLRRSSASASNNIAEGYNRYSYKERIRSLLIAKGEAEETKRNIIRTHKKGIIKKNITDEISGKYTELLKIISGYIRFIKTKNAQKLSDLKTSKLGELK